ncbi:MAG: hypothetical protein H6659_10920 [Ardenticatenaceae bacterium]|nr:hypothetical protein [Ardenticatenaceae bacterium]
MAQRQFELTTVAAVDRAFAFRFLQDLNNHRHLHPFFVQAEVVRSGVDEAGCSYQDLMVTERPQLAFWRYTIHFPTRMVVTGEYELTSYVEAALHTRLVNVMRCQSEQDQTRITESVTVTAPWMTMGYVRRQAFVAHQRTFSLLPDVLADLASRSVS